MKFKNFKYIIKTGEGIKILNGHDFLGKINSEWQFGNSIYMRKFGIRLV